jgi:hypothetical protein
VTVRTAATSAITATISGTFVQAVDGRASRRAPGQPSQVRGNRLHGDPKSDLVTNLEEAYRLLGLGPQALAGSASDAG